MSDLKGYSYIGNHIGGDSLQILQGTPNYDIEVSEGQNPPGEFYPAPYLPVVQSENRIGGSYFVLMPGKVIAFDTNKRLVPAGFSIDKLAYETAYNTTIAAAADPADPSDAEVAAAVAAGQEAAKIKYTTEDVKAGVVAPDGSSYVEADDYVVEKMIGSGIGITDPIGIMRYSALQAAGTDLKNPATFYKHSYDTGGARAFSRWCYVKVPVVETQARVEKMAAGATSHRLAVYPGTALVFKAGDATKTLAAVMSPTKFVDPTVAATPDQYCVIGRTIFFNCEIPLTWTVTYTPKIDLPFCNLTLGSNASNANDFDPTYQYANSQLATLLGQEISFDINSNFRLLSDASSSGQSIGRILDVKLGTNKDLNLVMSYFRDQGLWQETPGYATDGRNAQLSIVNAPKYIVNIAINFNVPTTIQASRISGLDDAAKASGFESTDITDFDEAVKAAGIVAADVTDFDEAVKASGLASTDISDFDVAVNALIAAAAGGG